MKTMKRVHTLPSINWPSLRVIVPALGLCAVLSLAGCSGGSTIGAETHSLKMVEAPAEQQDVGTTSSGETPSAASSGAPAAPAAGVPSGTGAAPAATPAASGETTVASTGTGAKTETPSGTEAGGGKVTTEYKLGTGDQLQVSIFGQPDLSGKFEVDGNGNITLPLIGPLKAEGRTVNEVQQSVTTSYDKSFLVNAKVSVQVLNYRPFYILGEIGKPGSYPYVSGLTIRQAIAIAGGFTRRARESPLRVIRSGQDSKEAEDATPDDPVLPGDTINVDRRIF
jgi:polysaccharide export outer membrane protein